MGLDGGTKISRSDVLRRSSWQLASQDNSRSTRGGTVSQSSVREAPKQQSRDADRAAPWSNCALTGEPLQPPIAADALGQLYNKAAMLQWMLHRKGIFEDEAARIQYTNQLRVAADALAHLKSLRDVLDVHLEPNTDAIPFSSRSAPSCSGVSTSSGSGGGSSDRGNDPGSGSSSVFRWMCPVTLLPCGRVPCSALRACGHVLSDRALAQAKGTCPVCGAVYYAGVLGEVVAINPPAEVKEALRQKFDVECSQDHARSKKRRKGGGDRCVLTDSVPVLQIEASTVQ